MKEKGNNVNIFWLNFKKAAIESGVKDTVAEWYVNWSRRLPNRLRGGASDHVQGRRNGFFA